jgi:hypothetical protein
VGQPPSPLGFRDISPALGASVTRARTACSAQQQRSRAAGTIPPGFGPSSLQTQFVAALGGAAQHSDGVQRTDNIDSSSPGEQHQARGPSDPIQQSSSGPRTEQPDRGPDSERQIEQRTPIQRDPRVQVLHRATPPAQLGALAATTPAIGEGITAESVQQRQQQAGTSDGQVRCDGCNGLFARRGITTHRRFCDRKRAAEAEQMAASRSQAGAGTRPTLPPRLPPSPTAWTWAQEIDLGAELLPDGLPISKRIPALVRREVSRAIAEHMTMIVSDPTDEASWSLFLLSVHLLLWPRTERGLEGIQELRDRVRRFEAGE